MVRTSTSKDIFICVLKRPYNVMVLAITMWSFLFAILHKTTIRLFKNMWKFLIRDTKPRAVLCGSGTASGFSPNYFKIGRYPSWIRAISLFLVLMLSINNISWAGSGERIIFDKNRNYIQHANHIQIDNFEIPSNLGTIIETNKGASGKTVIHIQDAHCNYLCQQSIESLIDYLNKEYGINTALLEGGQGDYDLSIFTNIEDKLLRRKVADWFVKEGTVNGAEFFAINNRDKITLQGLEKTDLYIENLEAYRESLTYKDEIDKLVELLNYYLTNLKRHIYSKELKAFEQVRRDYNDKNIKLNEYIEYLAKRAGQLQIDISGNKNLIKLIAILEQEKAIDFKIANSEREGMVDELVKRFSSLELETLVKKCVQFRKGVIEQTEFYSYLFRKAYTADVNIRAGYPTLVAYKKYIDVYKSVDSWVVFDEMKTLENTVAEKLFQSDKQKTLYDLSKRLAILENLFTITLTIDQYRYYQRIKDSLNIDSFLTFINSEAPKYKIMLSIPDNITLFDMCKEQMETFYKLAFTRDDVFIEKIKSSAEQHDTLIIVTGGFHTENLLKLLKENNISYISIMPSFSNETGYECPYYSVLSGEMRGFEKQIRTALSLIQVPSFLSDLGIKANDARQAELFRIKAIALQSMYNSPDTPYAFRLYDEGKPAEEEYMIFAWNDGNPDCLVSKTLPDNAKKLKKNAIKGNANSIIAAFSEIGQDRIIRQTEDRIYLHYHKKGYTDSPIIVEAFRIIESIRAGNTGTILKEALKALLKRSSYTDEDGRRQSLEDYSAIQLISDLYASHPGGQGIYLADKDIYGNVLSEEEIAFTLVHELIAGLYAGNKAKGLDSHSLAESVVNVLKDGKGEEAAGILAGADLYSKPVWNMTPEERLAINRDVADMVAVSDDSTVAVVVDSQEPINTEAYGSREFYVRRFQYIYRKWDDFIKQIVSILGAGEGEDAALIDNIAETAIFAVERGIQVSSEEYKSTMAAYGISRAQSFEILRWLAEIFKEKGPVDKAIETLEYICNETDMKPAVFVESALSLADIYGRLYVADPIKGRTNEYYKALNLVIKAIGIIKATPSWQDNMIMFSAHENAVKLKATLEDRISTVDELANTRIKAGNVARYVVPRVWGKGYRIYNRGVAGTWNIMIDPGINVFNLSIVEGLETLTRLRARIDNIIISRAPPQVADASVDNVLSLIRNENGQNTLYVSVRFLEWTSGSREHTVESFNKLIAGSHLEEVKKTKPEQLATIPPTLGQFGTPEIALVPFVAQSNLGVFTLSKYLRDRGIKVVIPKHLAKDVPLGTRKVSTYIPLIDDEGKQIFRNVDTEGPNILGISVTYDIEPVKNLMSVKKDAFTILGGPNTRQIEELLEAFPEENFIVVRGDGEEALRQICTIIGSSRPSTGLSEEQWRLLSEMDMVGLYVRANVVKDGHVTGARVLVKDIDVLNKTKHTALPDIQEIRRVWNTDSTYIARVMLTRGCPFNCAFCSKWMGALSLPIKPDEFISWLKLLAERGDVKKVVSQGQKLAIMIEDDNFLINRDYAKQILEGIVDNRLNEYFYFDCQLSVDSLLTKERKADDSYIDLLKRAGVRKVGIGVDGTINEHIQIHKNRVAGRTYRIEDVFAVTKELRKKGIKVWNYALLTNPYTTMSMYLRSLIVYYTSGLFPRDIEDDADKDFGIVSNQIHGEKGAHFNNEDIIHYPDDDKEVRYILKYVDPAVEEYAKNDLKKSVMDPQKLLGHMDQVYNRYPEYLTVLLNDLLNEDDAEMRALGAVIIYYIKKAFQESRKISFEILLFDLKNFMKDARVNTYQDLYEMRQLIDHRILTSKALEDDEIFESACRLPEGFMGQINTFSQTLSQKDPEMARFAGKDVVVSSSGTRMEHAAYHTKVVGENARVLQLIAEEIGADVTATGDYDFRKAIMDIEAGQNPGRLRIRRDNMNNIIITLKPDRRYLIMTNQEDPITGERELILIDDRLGADHAGRTRNQVYARSIAKALHELSELREWKAYEKKMIDSKQIDITGAHGAPKNIKEWIKQNIKQAHAMDRYFHSRGEDMEEAFLHNTDQASAEYVISHNMLSAPLRALGNFHYEEVADFSIEKALAEFSETPVSVEEMMRSFEGYRAVNLRLDISAQGHPKARDLQKMREVSKRKGFEISIFQRESTGEWFAVKGVGRKSPSVLKRVLLLYNDLSYAFHTHLDFLGQKSTTNPPSGEDFVYGMKYGDKRVDMACDEYGIYLYSGNGANIEQHYSVLLHTMNRYADVLRLEANVKQFPDWYYYKQWKAYVKELGFSLEIYSWNHFAEHEDEIYEKLRNTAPVSDSPPEDIIIQSDETSADGEPWLAAIELLNHYASYSIFGTTEQTAMVKRDAYHYLAKLAVKSRKAADRVMEIFRTELRKPGSEHFFKRDRILQSLPFIAVTHENFHDEIVEILKDYGINGLDHERSNSLKSLLIIGGTCVGVEREHIRQIVDPLYGKQLEFDKCLMKPLYDTLMGNEVVFHEPDIEIDENHKKIFDSLMEDCKDPGVLLEWIATLHFKDPAASVAYKNRWEPEGNLEILRWTKAYLQSGRYQEFSQTFKDNFSDLYETSVMKDSDEFSTLPADIFELWVQMATAFHRIYKLEDFIAFSKDHGDKLESGDVKEFIYSAIRRFENTFSFDEMPDIGDVYSPYWIGASRSSDNVSGRDNILIALMENLDLKYINEYLNINDILGMYKVIQMELERDGTIAATFYDISSTIADKLGTVSFNELPPLPGLPDIADQSIEYKDLLKELDISEDALIEPSRGSRSVIHKQGGNRIVIKRLDDRNVEDLRREAGTILWFNRYKDSLSLPGKIPKLISLKGMYVVKVKNIPNADGLIEEDYAIIYKASEGMVEQYLEEPSDVQFDDFKKSALERITELGEFAGKGIYHTSLTYLFHNTNQPDTSSHRVFDLFSATGVGRLDKWKAQYSNLRAEAIADYEHFLIDPNISAEKLMRFMANNLFEWSIIVGTHFRKRLDSRDAARSDRQDFINILKEGFEGYYTSANASVSGRWNMLSRRVNWDNVLGSLYDEMMSNRWEHNGVDPDLGPYNGPFPNQEFISVIHQAVTLLALDLKGIKDPSQDRSRKDEPDHRLVQKVFTLLPKEGLDKPLEVAEFIARYFKDQYEEAFSLMGKHLVNWRRWELVRKLVRAGLSVERIADLLNYSDYYDVGVTFETFPKPFQELILDSKRPSRWTVYGQDLDTLWAVYKGATPEWHKLLTGQGEGIKALTTLSSKVSRWAKDERTGIMPTYGERDELTEEALLRRTLKKSRAYFNKNTVNYVVHGTEQTKVKENKVIIDHIHGALEFSMGTIKEGQFKGKQAFSVWITDSELLKELKTEIPELIKHIQYEPLFEKEALHVSSIIYKESEHARRRAITIELLQSWLRLSDKQSKELRAKVPYIESLTEKAFRRYFVKENAEQIFGLSGNQVYENTTDPIHPNAVKRINDIFKNAGYKLVFHDKSWRWRLDCVEAQISPTNFGTKGTYNEEFEDLSHLPGFNVDQQSQESIPDRLRDTMRVNENGFVAISLTGFGPSYIPEVSNEMLDMLTGENGAEKTSVMTEPCTIGLVVKADPDERMEDVLKRQLAKEWDIIARKVEPKVLKERGLIECEPIGNVRYVIYVDDGSDSEANVARLRQFKRILSERKQANPKEVIFAWVASDIARQEIGDTAYMVGLEGDYLPVSWQMLAGQNFANFIYSKLHKTDAAERITDIIDKIIKCADLMTKGEIDLRKLQEQLKTRDIAMLFNGITITLPIPRPLTPDIEAYQKADKLIQTSL